MTAFVVAPNFHLDGGAAGRLLVATADGWGPPEDAQREALTREPAARDGLAGCVCLFALPGHLRASFWAMLQSGQDAFDGFAAAVGEFLAFKQLPAPPGAAFELALRLPGGEFDPRGVWAVVNLGDEAVWVGADGARLRLGPGEGCRVPAGLPLEVPPSAGEGPDVYLVVRLPATVP